MTRQQKIRELLDSHPKPLANTSEQQDDLVAALSRLIDEEIVAELEALFPEYSTVTNPGYSFIINKSKLDERIAALTPKPASTCPECSGKGDIIINHSREGKPNTVETCSRCNGKGVIA